MVTSMVTKQEVVLGQLRRSLVALFVTLSLSWLLNFSAEVLRRDLTRTGGTSGISGEL